MIVYYLATVLMSIIGAFLLPTPTYWSFLLALWMLFAFVVATVISRQQDNG